MLCCLLGLRDRGVVCITVCCARVSGAGARAANCPASPLSRLYSPYTALKDTPRTPRTSSPLAVSSSPLEHHACVSVFFPTLDVALHRLYRQFASTQNSNTLVASGTAVFYKRRRFATIG